MHTSQKRRENDGIFSSKQVIHKLSTKEIDTYISIYLNQSQHFSLFHLRRQRGVLSLLPSMLSSHRHWRKIFYALCAWSHHPFHHSALGHIRSEQKKKERNNNLLQRKNYISLRDCKGFAQTKSNGVEHGCRSKKKAWHTHSTSVPDGGLQGRNKVYARPKGSCCPLCWIFACTDFTALCQAAFGRPLCLSRLAKYSGLLVHYPY